MSLVLNNNFCYMIENVISKLLILLVCLLVLSCIILPSGSVYHINIKVILSVAVGIMLVIDMLCHKYINKYLTIITYSFVLFLLFYLVESLVYNIEIHSAITQTNAFMATFLATLAPLYIIKFRHIKANNLCLFILNCVIAYCIIKVCLELLVLCGYISLADLLCSVKSIFNSKIITLDLDFMVRLNLPNDFLLPGVIFSIMCCDILKINLGKLKRRIYLIITVIAIFISYSRFLWLFGAIAFIFGFFCSLRFEIRASQSIAEINKAKKIFAFYISIILCAILLVIMLSPALLQFIMDRYSGEFAKDSDSYRMVMKPLLYSMFFNKPFFGNGIGAYVASYVRFSETPWNYELQWIAFMMQFGVIGVLYLLVLFCAAVKSIFTSTILESYGLVILFIILLSVGFVNCFLLTSVTGVAYAYYIIMGIIIKMNNTESCKLKIKEAIKI